MSSRISLRHLTLQVMACCGLAMAGCATTMIPSQRLHETESSKVMGETVQFSGASHLGQRRWRTQATTACTSCEDRQRLQDYAQHAMPYVAGPFMHGGSGAEYVVQQATIQPPHSKFHPVPTRPVFETRASYLPPQPMGLRLVPVPEQGLPLSAPVDIDDIQGADPFALAPPNH